MERLKQLLGRHAKYERVADTEMVQAPSTVHKIPSSALVGTNRSALWAGHGSLHRQQLADDGFLSFFLCTMQLSVKGMTCSACTSAVEAALR